VAEIISIDGAKVKVGLDNSKIATVPIAVIAYANPKAGDEIKIYKDGDETVIKKVGSANTDSRSPVIHINNSNTMQRHSNNASDGVKKVNKIAYVLLLFFFGILGVHRFMRGQIGILYLLTLGLLGWGVIIDFIIALTKLDKYDEEYTFTRHGDWL
jgi:hypothetical protein